MLGLSSCHHISSPLSSLLMLPHPQVVSAIQWAKFFYNEHCRIIMAVDMILRSSWLSQHLASVSKDQGGLSIHQVLYNRNSKLNFKKKESVAFRRSALTVQLRRITYCIQNCTVFIPCPLMGRVQLDNSELNCQQLHSFCRASGQNW